MSTAELASLVQRLEAVTTRLESVGSGGVGDEGAAEFVEEYDARIRDGIIKKLLDLSKGTGGDVAAQAALLEKAFNVQREYLVFASKHKVPSEAKVQELKIPLEKAINEVQTFADKNRGSKQANYLLAVKEMTPALGWVIVSPKPGPYVLEAKNSAEFYLNRVIKGGEGKEWRKSALNWLEELQAYIKEYHTTGIAWNKAGADPAQAKAPGASGAAPPPPPPAGGAPPPPPPPAVVAPTPDTNQGGMKAAQANLFAEINQKGGGITSGLKKVTNDMKTYKNPELRGSSVVKAADLQEKKASKPTPAAAPAAKKPPVCALRGKQWIVEYQENNQDLNITDTNHSQTVYIYKCTKCTVRVSGKVNAIIVDNCKRVGVVFESVIGTVEFVNCQSVQAQATGKVRTVSIDKTDGCLVYLSSECLDCEFITAKSSEMNVSVPKGTDGEFNEYAIPEQYRTKYTGKGLHTECTDING